MLWKRRQQKAKQLFQVSISPDHTHTHTHTQTTCLFTNQRWLAPFHGILESLSNKVDTLLARHGVPDQKRENAATLSHTGRTAINPSLPPKKDLFTHYMKKNPTKPSNKRPSLLSPHCGYSVLLRKRIWTFQIRQRQTDKSQIDWQRQTDKSQIDWQTETDTYQMPSQASTKNWSWGPTATVWMSGSAVIICSSGGRSSFLL